MSKLIEELRIGDKENVEYFCMIMMMRKGKSVGIIDEYKNKDRDKNGTLVVQ